MLDIPTPYPVTPEWLSKAKLFLSEKWKERAKELKRPEPTDLSGACKFASLFGKEIFGLDIQGNWGHQFNVTLDGKPLDLLGGQTGDVNYLHDKKFFGNPEHSKSIESCKPRVMRWVEEFRQRYPLVSKIAASQRWSNPLLNGLKAEARKAPTFEDFKYDFSIDIKHGMYFHVTKDPSFRIDSEKGPVDASSLASSDRMEKGKLMVTSHLDYWLAEYEGYRTYVAIIDMSDVPRNAYHQVSRGFGNEFMVTDPSQAKVQQVLPIAKAQRLDERHHAALDFASDDDLLEFYNLFHDPEAPQWKSPKEQGKLPFRGKGMTVAKLRPMRNDLLNLRNPTPEVLPPVDTDPYEAHRPLPDIGEMIGTPGRWYKDLGAIPGEALFTLDSDDENSEGKAAIVETDTEPVEYELYLPDGELLGMTGKPLDPLNTQSVQQIAERAEKYIDAHPGAGRPAIDIEAQPSTPPLLPAKEAGSFDEPFPDGRVDYFEEPQNPHSDREKEVGIDIAKDAASGRRTKILWLRYEDRIYSTPTTMRVLDHSQWLRDMSLPWHGPEYDRIERGTATIDGRTKRVYLVRDGGGFVPRDVVEHLVAKYNLEGWEMRDEDSGSMRMDASKTAAPRSIWYHGSSIKNLRSILKQGLIPDVKERNWGNDPDASAVSVSRESIEGSIYLTRNLLTATGSPKDHNMEGREVIVIAEIQPNSLYLDEDSVVFYLSHPLGDLSDNTYYSLPTYLGKNGTWKEFADDQRQKYIDQAVRGIAFRYKKPNEDRGGLPALGEMARSQGERNNSLHPGMEERLRALLPEVWEAALLRIAAHEAKKAKPYDLRNAYHKAFPQVDYDSIPDVQALIPPPEEGEAAFRGAVEKITKALRQLARPLYGDVVYNSDTARVTTPIGYSGSNHIIAVVECQDGRKYRSNDEGEWDWKMPAKLIVHWGSIPPDFLQQWTACIGDNFVVERPAVPGKAAAAGSANARTLQRYALKAYPNAPYDPNSSDAKFVYADGTLHISPQSHGTIGGAALAMDGDEDASDSDGDRDIFMDRCGAIRIARNYPDRIDIDVPYDSPTEPQWKTLHDMAKNKNIHFDVGTGEELASAAHGSGNWLAFRRAVLGHFSKARSMYKIGSSYEQMEEALSEGEGDLASVQAVLSQYQADLAIEYEGGKLYTVGEAVVDVTDKGIITTWQDANDFLNGYNTEQYLPFDPDEQFNKDFWDNPSELYHGTLQGRLESIMKEGLSPRNETRGMSNRGVHSAVFTSTDWDEANHYYETVLSIDTAAMKAELPPTGLPFAGRESDIVEGEGKEALANALGYEDYSYDFEQGMSPNTVILYGAVPPKYLSVAKEDTNPSKRWHLGSKTAAIVGRRRDCPAPGAKMSRETPCIT